MLAPESKRVHFCPSVSALRAQSRGLNEPSAQKIVPLYSWCLQRMKSDTPTVPAAWWRTLCYTFRYEGFLQITQTVRQGRVIGLEGPTRMDKNGHVSVQGEALVGFRVQIQICGTHQVCPHSGWTWEGHMGSNNSKIIENVKNITSQQVLGRNTGSFEKMQRPKWPHWQNLSIWKVVGPILIEKSIKTKDKIQNLV